MSQLECCDHILVNFCVQKWSHRVFSSVKSLSHVWPFATSMDCSMPVFPVHHQLPELALTHVHQVCDAIQSSHSLLSPSPPAFNLPQHQGLFQWISSLHQVAKILELQLQHQSFPWIFRIVSFRIDWFDLLAVQETLKSLLQHKLLCVDSLKGNFYTISSEPARKKTMPWHKKKEGKEETKKRSKEG